MNIRFTRFVAILLMGMAVTACGGGGGGPPPPATIEQGQFVDSPVIGLRYVTATQSGFTDSNGLFDYQVGETIQFFVGDILLGEATAKAIMSPIDFVASAVDETNPQVINMIRFLQTLDEDSIVDNGITITIAVNNQAIGKTLDFSLSENAFAFDSNTAAVVAELTAVLGSARQLVTSASAQDHFRRSLLTLYAGTWQGGFSGDDTGTWEVVISKSGVITGVSVSDTFGSDPVNGVISSSGQASINGTAGTSVFSGGFTFAGTVSGTWLDDDGSAGTFSGSRIRLPDDTGTPVNFGSLNLTGTDTNVLGGTLTPNVAPFLISDLVGQVVGVVWGHSEIVNGNIIVTSVTVTFPFNDTVQTVSLVRTSSNATGINSVHTYQLDCEVTPTACTVSVNRAQSSINFTDLTFTADTSDPQNSASADMSLNGVLNW